MDELEVDRDPQRPIKVQTSTINDGIVSSYIHLSALAWRELLRER